MLSFYCEGLPEAGLVLVPNGAPRYPALLSDIKKRVDEPAYDTSGWSPEVREFVLGRISEDDWETSAILLNESGKSVASMLLLWKLTERSGRTDRHSQRIGSGPLLMPSDLGDPGLRMLVYSSTIMAGSKRHICLNGVAGDNSDVRLPESGEIYSGGYVIWGGPPENQHLLRSVRLSIDGVFFADGEFVGPNTEGMWEQTLYTAELRKRVGDAVSEGHKRGDPLNAIFAAIEEITGPETPPRVSRFNVRADVELHRQMERYSVACRLAAERQYNGDESTIAKVLAWAEADVSRLHRRWAG